MESTAGLLAELLIHQMFRRFYPLGLAGLLFLAACSLPARVETGAPPGPTMTQAGLLVLSPAPARTSTSTVMPIPVPSQTQTDTPGVTFTATPSATPSATATPTLIPPPVPVFSHIGIIILENREFGSVIGSPTMPYFNQLASENTLLTQHFAILHPSLPNYLALIGGETFGITANCIDCFVNAPSLPDLLEASGRTWKTYQEDIPEPCFVGDSVDYYQKHNPFIYFDPIRLNTARCQQSIVPLEEIHTDLRNKTLPDFFFITPNICNSAHDCELNISDIWLANLVPYLMAYPAMRQNGLLIITWDEGQGDHGCCGIEPGGGRIATLLISPLARPGFQDATPYTHYAILKMIAAAWNLPELGHAADASTALITEPWLKK